MCSCTFAGLCSVGAVSSRPGGRSPPCGASSIDSSGSARGLEQPGDTLVKLANVMPEDKFRFKPTPPQRDYGEQILHIAEANVVQMGRLGAKVTPPTINMKAASKAEIVKALEDSFDYGIAVLKEQTDQTMVQAAETTRFDRFMGPSTRSRVVAYVMGHTWDIYGQMVVYVRLNGLTPPASQRP
jgi:uncharacterized damage-inducible protein DinB